MNFIEFSWNLINCGFYGNQRNSGLALCLKMLALATTINVPDFMFVSKSAHSPEISSYAAGLCRGEGAFTPQSRT